VAQAQGPRTRVLRGVTVSPGRDWTIIEIHLNGQFRYTTHSPSSGQTTLQIRLHPEIRPTPGRVLRTGGTLEWRDRDLVGLIDVEANVDSAGSTQLVLHFNTPMEFEVSQNRDLERVRVAVRPIGAVPEATPNLALPEIVAPDPEPLPTDQAAPEDAEEGGDRVDQIMAEGRKAMTEGKLARAILLYTKVLGEPEHPRAPEAKELLGLARQRNGQLAHARAEYEEYLESYADSEGAPRVRQRLEALLTAKGGQPRAARPSARSRSFAHDFSGSISQFYRSDILSSDATGTDTSNAAFDSDLFLSSRHSRGGTSYRTNFAASYRHDMLENLGLADAMRVSSAFVDARWNEEQYSMRLGRQSPSVGGVMGRFDGVVLGTPVSRFLRLNLVSGFPVDFTESNRVDTDRYFYGLSADIATFWHYWDAQLFGIQQRIGDFEDRTAVGGQLRFTHSDGFGLGLVDYDTSYGELNTAMLIANWRLSETTTFNALVDIRKSPFLTTFNALQGQSVTDLDELEDLFSKDEIRQFAQDRTATSRMFTLGAWHQLNSTWQVSGDVTLSNLSDTKASGGVVANEGTGNEFFYALRTTATNLLVEGSFTTFAARYADANTSDRYELSAGGRYPLIERVRVGPQIAVELRRNHMVADQMLYRPSLRLEYRRRSFSFELEGGVEIAKGTANDANADENRYFFSVGYRYDF
jgi:hypothetical protein